MLGTRADGYHELRTIFQSIALHDTLTIRAIRGPFRLTCDDPACPADDTNLVCARGRAACGRAAGRRGAPRGVAIDLHKRIPMQAGLGGGSSDARGGAARARAACGASPMRRSRAAAAALGADVPYFLEGGTALGLERGDLLFPLLDPPPAWVVLVLPDFGVSTRDAFGWFDAQRARGAEPRGRRSPRSGRAPELTGQRSRGAGRGAPSRDRPYHFGTPAVRAPSQAAMSGSGSAVFGLFSVASRRRFRAASTADSRRSAGRW